ncbi:MAG: transcription antitermination factor NusB [Dehalococcoidia bacterium]|nr:transcription antitermination factor NusB [Dehalococcoidia bacterium]
MASSRRRSRIAAFHALFEADMGGRPLEPVLARHLTEAGLDAEGVMFARGLAEGVETNLEAIDEVIGRFAPAFPLAEMAAVDRNVLRLAVYEVLFDTDSAPLRAAINEAVEIAKGYGSESSGRFINGVLGAVVLEAAERQGSAGQEESGPPEGG